MSRDTNFIFLPSDKNLLRLESCDFHLEENTKSIQCCLKKILNPTLILFYYNHTSKKILTEFFKASRETELERGKEKDNYRQKQLLDSETEFKFASVNLDYEEDLFKVLTKIEDGNPFKWLEIVTGNQEEEEEVQKEQKEVQKEQKEQEEEEEEEETKTVKERIEALNKKISEAAKQKGGEEEEKEEEEKEEGEEEKERLKKRIDRLKSLEKNKYPFLVFYYQSIPQYLYEGRLSSDSLLNEFRNWYKELMEEKQERRKNTNSYFDGIYIAVGDGELKNSLADDDPKNFKFNKGEIFRIKVYNEKVFFSKDLTAGVYTVNKLDLDLTDLIGEDFSDFGDNSVDFGFNEDKLRSFFRKLDIEKQNKIEENQLQIYKDMYKISHPGDNKKKKKQVYLDYDFFIPERGNKIEEKMSKNFIDLFSEFSGKEEFMTQQQLGINSLNQKRKAETLRVSLRKKKDIDNLLTRINKILKSGRIKTESLKSIRLLRIRQAEEDGRA